MNKIMYLKSLK